MVEGWEKVSGNVFASTGDIGDVIASLPAVRALGGGHYAIGYRPGPGYGRESMEGKRFDAIRPLLEEQSYIRGVKWIGENFSGVTHDFSTWRRIWVRDESLLHAQARYLGVKASEDPWLTATPNREFRGKTVIARSARYHERSFPWPQMMEENPDAIFVGLPAEHAAFQHRYGTIEYVETADLLEMAEIMAAAKLCISNQTAAFWVAIGLGVDTIQETWSGSRDSVIHRPNARYFYKTDSRKKPVIA